jgi:ABC-type Fe3+/spermidine/putrescine transport system ATPase subunit
MSAEMKVEHLRKVFSTGVAAVDDVSFDINPGEIVVLLGPSGCGKTTTLRCVAGLESATSGMISIGGKVVSAPDRGVLVPPRLRNIGMVFQSYAVWPHMTVLQNVAYPLRHRAVSRQERDRKIRDVLDLVGLSAYAERPVTQLSGGQMQRVALARSLVYAPQLLLLAAADTLYNKPANLFVANFTGASNLLDGRVLERQDEFGIIGATTGQRLSAWLPSNVAVGEDVKVAVRPENVRLGANGSADPNTFNARVAATRYQGTQTVYELDLLGGRIDALELGTRVRYPVGSDVDVVLPPALCWAYPAIEGGASD